MNRYPNLQRINPQPYGEVESPQAVPGAGLDVLMAIASRPADSAKTWLWLVELRVHLGKVTRCHSAAFAIAPPGDVSLTIPVTAPHGDTVDQFLGAAIGYAVINRNLDRVVAGASNAEATDFIVNALAMLADEPGAIDDLLHWQERVQAATPTTHGADELIQAMAEATHCPGLGPVALTQALDSELLYNEHRQDLELIARDEEIAHVHLGINDNIPQPEVCTEPPVFEELGS